MIQTHSSNLHVSRYAPDSTMAPHQHDQSWLCLVIDGQYQERIHSREQDHRRGDLLYCPAHTTHAQRIGSSGSTKILWTPSRDSLDYLLDQNIVLAHAPSVRGSPDLQSLGARLWQELAIGDAFAPLAVDGLALELVAAFGRSLGSDGARRPAGWLLQLRERLDEDAPGGLSLNHLAAEVGRHPVHVARTFREVFGCTIGGYARRARAEKAAALLRSTRRPLIDIALECGYGNASQFSRSFKAVFGVVPSAYRALSR
jgi:AraC family transcriptional regulator